MAFFYTQQNLTIPILRSAPLLELAMAGEAGSEWEGTLSCVLQQRELLLRHWDTSRLDTGLMGHGPGGTVGGHSQTSQCSWNWALFLRRQAP